MTTRHAGNNAEAFAPCCNIVEIRQYTLFPGTRDTLIDLFERHFAASLEANGMHIIGTFRTVEDPNRFFWIRGFSDMESRKRSLEAFYFGHLWKAYRTEANATMVDSDNVLLVRPIRAEIDTIPERRNSEGGGILTATIYHPEQPVTDEFDLFFERFVHPRVRRAGGCVVGKCRTENAVNDFPALPVRSVESFAWFAWYKDVAAFDRFRRSSDEEPEAGLLRQQLSLLKVYSPPESWRLLPTAQSRLRC